jgi:hypothetical protein
MVTWNWVARCKAPVAGVERRVGVVVPTLRAIDLGSIWKALSHHAWSMGWSR